MKCRGADCSVSVWICFCRVVHQVSMLSCVMAVNLLVCHQCRAVHHDENQRLLLTIQDAVHHCNTCSFCLQVVRRHQALPDADLCLQVPPPRHAADSVVQLLQRLPPPWRWTPLLLFPLRACCRQAMEPGPRAQLKALQAPQHHCRTMCSPSRILCNWVCLVLMMARSPAALQHRQDRQDSPGGR